MTTHELRMIAQYELAKGVSNDIPAMKDFLSFWLKALSPEDRLLVALYRRAMALELDLFEKQFAQP
jgi:hypothetical protein